MRVMRQAARSLLAAAVGAAVARGGLRAANGLAHGKAADDGVGVGVGKAGAGFKAGVLDVSRWDRTNHRGEPVTLLEGPIFAVAAAAGVLAAPGLPGRLRAAGVTAAVGAGAFGVYDDLCGNADRRGIKGHLTALTHGEVTTGGVKVVGIGAVGVLGGCLVRRGGGVMDKALAAVVIAGAANAVNLLDLRPGRAIKGAALAAAPGMLRRAAAEGGVVGTSASAGGTSVRGGRRLTAAAVGGASAVAGGTSAGGGRRLASAVEGVSVHSGRRVASAVGGVSAHSGRRVASTVVGNSSAGSARRLTTSVVGGAPLSGAANTLVAVGLGAAAALLPEDLGERAMLGDAGANALGALLGVAAAAGARSTAALAWRAAALTAVTLASEKVSFTKVIAGCPPLNAVDMWGRRPAAVPHVPAQPAGTAETTSAAGAAGTTRPAGPAGTAEIAEVAGAAPHQSPEHLEHLDHTVHPECSENSDRPEQSDCPAHSEKPEQSDYPAHSEHPAHPTATSADGPAGTGQEPDPRG